VVNTYTCSVKGGAEYTLKITDNTTYGFLINGASVSTGSAKQEGDTWILTPNGDPDKPFTVTVSGRNITNIAGDIIPDDGTEPIPPGEILQVEPVAGVWKWATSDDSQLNDWKTSTAWQALYPGVKQSIYAPGGASKITNAEFVDTTTDPIKGESKNYKPFEYPAGTVKDKDGNPITVPVYNFKGNTKVTEDNRTANSGARFPMVGWEATPDDAETLALLKTAYGYSFWVRLNSSTANNWSFLTAVVTDFTPEEGYEYKHYFGNNPGDSTSKNQTQKLEVGTWYQIKVVMAKDGFNLDQDKWIHQYNPEYEGSFTQNAAQKIQWQIPLQHQVGAGVSARSGDPYDIIKGSYDFDLDFYGLELLK